jgi:membrane protein
MLNWIKRSLWPNFWGTLYEWQRDNASQMAAALAFYTAFSFFPLILVLLSVFGFFLDYVPDVGIIDLQHNISVQDKLVELVRGISPVLSDQFAAILKQVGDKSAVSGPVGFAILLLGAIGIFANMETAFSAIWKEYLVAAPAGIWQTVKRVLYGRLKAFIVVLGLGLFVLLTFISTLAISTTLTFLKDWNLPVFAIQMGTRAAGIVLNCFLFVFMYRLFSPRVAWWSDCLRGSIVASIFWELGRVGLEQYLLRGTYSPYGVVGSFIALMLWFYYAWSVVFFGAEYAQVAHYIRVERSRHSLGDTEETEALTSSML